MNEVLYAPILGCGRSYRRTLLPVKATSPVTAYGGASLSNNERVDGICQEPREIDPTYTAMP